MNCLDCKEYEVCHVESRISDACVQEGAGVWSDELTTEIIKQIRELVASKCPRYQEDKHALLCDVRKTASARD